MVLAGQSRMNWADRGASALPIQRTGSMTVAVRSAIAGIAVIALLGGSAALAYARWTRAAAAGDSALADGRYEEALARYAEAESRFERFAAIRQLFADDYGHVMANQ